MRESNVKLIRDESFSVRVKGNIGGEAMVAFYRILCIVLILCMDWTFMGCGGGGTGASYNCTDDCSEKMISICLPCCELTTSEIVKLACPMSCDTQTERCMEQCKKCEYNTWVGNPSLMGPGMIGEKCQSGDHDTTCTR